LLILIRLAAGLAALVVAVSVVSVVEVVMVLGEMLVLGRSCSIRKIRLAERFCSRLSS